MHPGDIIAGKYRVANVLGRGRGLLLEARHTEFDQRVVIRLLSPHMCDEKQLEQFRREARTLSKLESEHVARIIDVGTHSDGSFFFVRQYLDGIDLGTHIRSQGALRLEEAVLYILQAAEAVQETHSHSIVLRELQPSHVFLTRRRGGAPLVKITDFGTAKVLKDPAAQVVDGEMTATVMFGMSQYSSPELVRKAKDVDARTDVWSLGCILYEMLTAMTPFQGEMAELMLKITREEPIPLSNLRPDLPQEIDQIMGWALAKDRNARFSSVYAFAHALKPYSSPEGQVLIDQIGRLAHAKNDDQSSGQISPTSPLAKRRGMPDDEDRTVIRQVPSYPGGSAGAGEHDFERTQFMGNGPGSVPPPAMGSQPGRGSVPPPAMGSQPGRGSVPPPAMGSQPGSVPPPAMAGHPAVPSARAPQGSWVEADPAAPSGVAAASQAYGVAPKKKNRGLVIALGAALVLLPVAVVGGILAMRSGGEGDEIAQADTNGADNTTGEPAPPLTENTDDGADEQPTATDDGATEGDEPTELDEDDGGEDDGGEDDGGDEDGGDEPEPKTVEAPTPTPGPKAVAPQPPAPKPDDRVSSTKKKKKATKKKKKKKPPPPPESGGTGTLVAIAIGGSCSFAVDGAPRGTKSSIRIKVPVGRHTVSCTPPKGATRTQSVNVKSGKPGIASFRLN